MRIDVGVTTQKVGFVAVDSSDPTSRKTGLSSWTVYYSLNGGTATAMTTPTIAELDATNMPGDYTLLVDEAGMTSAKGELLIHITSSGMAEVTRTIEIRPVYEEVNVIEIGGDATAGTNFKDMYDGTGYAGGTTSLRSNVNLIRSSVTAANNLKNDYDGTGYNKSASTIGTVTNNSDKTGYSVDTVNDKTGYALSAAGIDGIWDETQDGHAGDPATVGYSLKLIGLYIAGFIGADNLVKLSTDNTLLGTDEKALISTDAQDLSGSLGVDSKALRGQALDSYVGSNFNLFFENNSGATTKVVDDVGGAGAGSEDWTATEKQHIRHRLGIDGASSAPTATPSLSTFDASSDGVDVEKIEGKTLSGYTGDNFDSFFHNTGASTSKVVDDVGGGSGVADWTTTEKQHIRKRLGIDGASSSPTATPDLSTFDHSSDQVTVATNNDKTGYGLANDAITSAKYDETTAFPLKSEDSGATQVARTGLLGDTLETLSDEITVVDGVADAIKAKTDNLPADPASETNVDANEAKIDIIDTVVDAIKAKTDNLPTDPADQSLVEAALAITEVALTAEIDANEAKIDTIDTVVDNIWTKVQYNPESFKKNTAFNNFQFVMLDSTTEEPKSGETVTAQRIIDDAAIAACTNSVVEISDGFYRINLHADDLNGDMVTLIFTSSGAKTTIAHIKTEP